MIDQAEIDAKTEDEQEKIDEKKQFHAITFENIDAMTG